MRCSTPRHCQKVFSMHIEGQNPNRLGFWPERRVMRAICQDSKRFVRCAGTADIRSKQAAAHCSDTGVGGLSAALLLFDHFPKETQLYKLMSTKLEEAITV